MCGKYSAIGVSGALTFYFGTFFWEFNNVQLALLAIESIIAAGLALILAPWASRKIGKRNAAFIFAVLAVFLGVLPYALRLSGLFFENGDPRLLPTYFAIRAVYSMCGVDSAVLVHAMIGDIVDHSNLKIGRRAEGLFHAANSFMQKSVSGIGVFIAGLMLAFVYFPEQALPGDVSQETINALVIAYVPALVILYLGGARFSYFYRLGREDHEANIQAVCEREAASQGE